MECIDMDRKRVACELLKLAKDLIAGKMERSFSFINDRSFSVKWSFVFNMTSLKELNSEEGRLLSVKDKEVRGIYDDTGFLPETGKHLNKTTFVQPIGKNIFLSTSMTFVSQTDQDKDALKSVGDSLERAGFKKKFM
jgi:hypothetical protein